MIALLYSLLILSVVAPIAEIDNSAFCVIQGSILLASIWLAHRCFRRGLLRRLHATIISAVLVMVALLSLARIL